MLKPRRLVKYLGPVVFFLGLAYTALYPERNLLGKSSRDLSESNPGGTTPFDLSKGEPTSEDGPVLSKCRVWLYLSESTSIPTKLTSCSVESALIHFPNTSHSICVVADKFAELKDGPRLKERQRWLEKLSQAYGPKLVKHVPDYGSVFAGTLFEETYVNSGDLSFLSPALIWSLLWKHGGLLLKPDTVLVSGLKSYYNFLLLNKTSSGSTLSLVQFTERHHELPGQVLNHFMEQALRLKQVARERQANAIRMGVETSSDNAKLTLTFLTDREWTLEVEKYCGRGLSKTLIRHMCQDTEVVAYDSVPAIDDNLLRTLGLDSNLKRVAHSKLLQYLALSVTQDAKQLPDELLSQICPVTYKNY